MELKDLLASSSLWRSIASSFDRARSNEWDLREIEWDDCELMTRIQLDRVIRSDIFSLLSEVFQKKVVSKLARLPEVTAAELSRVAFSQLAGLPVSKAATLSENELLRTHPDVAFGLQRFVAFARALVLQDFEYQDGPFALGKWDIQTSEKTSWSLRLWDCKNYSLVGRLEQVGLDSLTSFCASGDVAIFSMFGDLLGTCSEVAMENVASRLKPSVEAAAKTARFSYINPSSAPNGFWNNLGPPIEFITSGDGNRVFQACLSHWIDDKTNGDDLLLNIQQAATCLAEADAYENSADAFLKCFAAIEVLVCFNKEKQLVEQIRQYVPALMQPDGLGRVAKGEVLSRFYNLRSENAHGPKTTVTLDQRNVMRRLASGVIRAAVLWRDHQLRIGDSTSRNQFKLDLRHVSGDGMQFTQVGVDMSQMLPSAIDQVFDPDDPGAFL